MRVRRGDSQLTYQSWSVAKRRSGYVLVFVAMLLFGLLGLAALVIDIGFGRLTQRQMKQATDTSALAALQNSDVLPTTPETYSGRTSDTELGRRQSAANMVTVLFDDDFDDTSDTRNFGAGPQVNLTGSIALQDGFSASQLLTLPAETAYKPNLELNTGNDQTGDVVTAATEVAVRLHRDNTGIDAGVKSNGGPVPYLFGRGSLASSATKAAGMQFAVRSVAETRPVVRIGEQQTVNGITIPGGIPFGISRTVWESLPANVATATPLAAGTVGTSAAVVREIGREISVLPITQTTDGYCAIFQSIGGNLRVIGFGWVQIEPDPADIANILITKHRATTDIIGNPITETIAAENATPRLSEAWDALAVLSDADREDVIAANRTFTDPLVSAVLRAGD